VLLTFGNGAINMTLSGKAGKSHVYINVKARDVIQFIAKITRIVAECYKRIFTAIGIVPIRRTFTGQLASIVDHILIYYYTA